LQRIPERRLLAVCSPISPQLKAGRMQGVADVADAAVRRRARGIPLALSDDSASVIGSV